MSDIQKLDPNMAPAAEGSDLVWCDCRQLGVEGRGWDDTESYYNRLPARAKEIVNETVWRLSQWSAGLRFRFVTDATAISARWTLLNEPNPIMLMAGVGANGVDLYGLHEGRWRYAGFGSGSRMTNQAKLVGNMQPRRRQFQLNLPLYNGVTSVEIGLPRGAVLEPAPPYDLADPRPICFYGTSINQGGCASRPGMTHTQILSRRLLRPVLNLGFAGSARCEIELANLLAELDPMLYVIDPLPNMRDQMVRERMTPFVQRLRDARPKTPIVLVESITYQDGCFDTTRVARQDASNGALMESYQQLTAAGMCDLHYVKGDNLLGDDTDATIDGTHPTDLGFMRLAQGLEPLLRSLTT